MSNKINNTAEEAEEQQQSRVLAQSYGRCHIRMFRMLSYFYSIRVLFAWLCFLHLKRLWLKMKHTVASMWGKNCPSLISPAS